MPIAHTSEVYERYCSIRKKTEDLVIALVILPIGRISVQTLLDVLNKMEHETRMALDAARTQFTVPPSPQQDSLEALEWRHETLMEMIDCATNKRPWYIGDQPNPFIQRLLRAPIMPL
jgi:hypothetical protein